VNATVHQLKPAPVLRASCTQCGTEAACDCNAPYVPARERAAAAIVATPEKSNRAIAAEIGVSDKTVAAARAEHSAPAPETVVGKDGKEYPSTAAKPYSPDDWVRDMAQHRTAHHSRPLTAVERVNSLLPSGAQCIVPVWRRKAIRTVAMQMKHEFDSAIADVLRQRKEPYKQTRTYEAAIKILAEMQALLDLAKVAP
jgi:hypothetical protein